MPYFLKAKLCSQCVSNFFFRDVFLFTHCLLILYLFKGLRSKMGAGFNRINDLTIIQATQVGINELID